MLKEKRKSFPNILQFAAQRPSQILEITTCFGPHNILDKGHLCSQPVTCRQCLCSSSHIHKVQKDRDNS